MTSRNYSLVLAVALALSGPAAFSADDGDFQLPAYHYGVYYMVHSPKNGSLQRPVYDVTTPRLRDRMFIRLQEAGMNMATYAYVYRKEGAFYPHDNPKLKPQVRQWRGRTPVKDFLDDCHAHGIQGFIGIHVRPEEMKRPEYLQYLEDVTRDLAGRFKGHPGLAGFVPPVESLWQKISHHEYAHLAKTAKEVNPDLLIMDFPSGPHVPPAVEAVMGHAHSGAVDIENVQFFVGNSSVFSYYLSMYREMAGYRGLTLMVEGLSPRIRSMCHTHYMQGGAKANIPQEQGYRVSQNVLLTATRFGVHSFTYTHLFHGFDNRSKRDTLWRWVKYCEGMLSVQRYAPYYAEMEPLADVTVVIPRNPDLGGPDLVNLAYTPLAVDHIPVKFASELSGLSSSVVVLPSPIGLSESQVEAICRYVRQGGTLVSILDAERNMAPKAEMNYDEDFEHVSFEIGMDSGQIHPKISEMLAVDLSRFRSEDLMLVETLPGFPAKHEIRARGFSLKPLSEAAVLARWKNGEPAMTRHAFGGGSVYVMPGGLPFLASSLAKLVRCAGDISVEAAGLPDSYLVERYTKRSPQDHEMLLILGTEEGSTATGVSLAVGGRPRRFCVYLDDDRAELLEPEYTAGKTVLHLPEISEYGVVIMTDETLPLLHPNEKVRSVRCGSKITVAASLLNLTASPLTGVLELELPPGWNTPDGQAQSYQIAPGRRKELAFDVNIPADAERDAHFLTFSTRGLKQRTMLIPADGKPRLIMDGQTEPDPLPDLGKIGAEWLAVEAERRASCDPG